MVTRDDRQSNLGSLILVILSISVLAVYTVAIGEPTGPDSLNNQGSERYTENGPLNTTAQAGNVTALTFDAETPTKAWQGYYGNITGTITLEDSSGNTFYNWTANEPKGEIYASTNSTVDWATIQCFNFNADGASEPNLTTEESRYGIDDLDVDGINETFDGTDHDTFFVGTTQLSGCPTTHVYQNSGAQTSNFQNVLLSSTGSYSLVFTTIIENRLSNNNTDLNAFNNEIADFQMLVAEDEHNSSSAGPTTYYFWVEIE